MTKKGVECMYRLISGVCRGFGSLDSGHKCIVKVKLLPNRQYDADSVSLITIIDSEQMFGAEYGKWSDGKDHLKVTYPIDSRIACGIYFRVHNKVYVGLTEKKDDGGTARWQMPRFHIDAMDQDWTMTLRFRLSKRFPTVSIRTLDNPVILDTEITYSDSDAYGVHFLAAEIQYNEQQFMYGSNADVYFLCGTTTIENDEMDQKTLGLTFFPLETLSNMQDSACSIFAAKYWTAVLRGEISLTSE